MRRFLTINVVVALFFLFGCQQETTVTSPEGFSNKQLKLIELPALKGMTTETLFTQQKSLSGNYGGTFAATFGYQSVDGWVNIQSDLVFPSGSFSGWVTFTQTFNTETASTEFGPSMQFSAPVRYTLTVTGVDLTNVNPNTLDFVYVDAQGNLHQVVYDSVTMDANLGQLKVTNARLNHFSRYGFVN